MNMNLLEEGVVGIERQSAAALFRMRLTIKARMLCLDSVIGVADGDVLPPTRVLKHLQFVVFRSPSAFRRKPSKNNGMKPIIARLRTTPKV